MEEEPNEEHMLAAIALSGLADVRALRVATRPARLRRPPTWLRTLRACAATAIPLATARACTG